jgi:hypothetical protein
MNKRLALILVLVVSASVMLLWTHQIVIGQNGVPQGGNQADVTNGVLGWWPFDEGRGTNTFDASGNGRTGALIGNPLPIWTSGVSSNALEFDGIQNDVQVPTDPGLTPAGLTLTTWVKVAPNMTSEAIAKWAASGGGSYALSLTNGSPELDLSLGGSLARLAGTIAILDSQWHHIAGTYDGTQMQVFLDGVNVGSASATGSIDSAQTPLVLGLVAGRMDDVRVYGRALSSNEIASVYVALAEGANAGSGSNGVAGSGQSGTQLSGTGLTNEDASIASTNLQGNAQVTITTNPPSGLQNPSFESGDPASGHAITGWTNFGENGPNVFHESLMPRSGSYHLKVFGAFTGPTNFSGAYQDIPAQAGQTWRASAYVATPTNDAIRCTSRARIQLEFYGSSTNPLLVASSADFTEDDLQNVYRLLSATATAPQGTVRARIVCIFEQRWQTPGSVFFDDANLSMFAMSVGTNCQAVVPDLSSLATVPTGSALSQIPGPGTPVNLGTTNISLTVVSTNGQNTTYSLPFTAVRDVAPTVIGPSPMVANPSFEDGGGPHGHLMYHWTGFGTPDTNMINAFQVPYVPRSGAFVAKLFQEWSAPTNYTGLYQELPANPGETWYAGVYIWLPADDPIAGANKARVRLEFYDVSHNLLAQSDSPDLTAYSPQDVWTPMGIWAIAPTNTAYARLSCLFVGDGISTGSAYFDDATLTKIVVPVGDSCHSASLPDLTLVSTATDSCGKALSVSQSPPAGTSIPVGVTSVMLTATDDAGNIGHYRVDVAAVDTKVPVFAVTSADIVCPYAPSNTALVASIPGASYQWTVQNATILAGQGTSSIIWQAGETGWSVLNATMTTPTGCSYANWKAVTVQCSSGWFDNTEAGGLTNGQEIGQSNANPAEIAAAGNGISSYEELYLALVNPQANNFDGTVTDAAVQNGANISNELGNWQADGTEIYDLDRRGYVEYTVTIPSADVYRLVLDGREQNSSVTNTSSFDLQAYVDGEYLGRQTLQATTSSYGFIHLYTPYLQPGSHTVRIFWDNAASGTSLRIKDVRLQILGGPSTNGTGLKNWVLSRLHTMCGFNPALPVTSYVSPISAEGNERFLSMMTIAAGTVNLPPQHGPGDRWYANVPLTTGTGTVVVVSYQNGALTQTGTVQWVARNIVNSGTINIRKGDNLLLTAAPVGATNGAVQLTVLSGQQTVGQYSTSASVPVVVPFPVAGTYAVSGVFTSITQSVSGTLIVNVVDQSFTTDPAVWVAKTRSWAVPGTNVVLDADPRLMMVPVGAPTNSTQNFNLMIDQNEPRYVASRVGVGGAILNSARADGFQLYVSSETYVNVLQTYPDGSKLVETMEVLSPVLPDITVQILVLVGGVTFEDGTTFKELTAADFDALGQYRLRFLMPAGVQTADCHRIQVMQGATLVGVHH